MADITDRDQLDLWAAHHAEAVTIESFLQWCEGEGMSLMVYPEGRQIPRIVTEPRGSILYRYFGVDPKRLENQRRALLEACRG